MYDHVLQLKLLLQRLNDLNEVCLRLLDVDYLLLAAHCLRGQILAEVATDRRCGVLVVLSAWAVHM